MLGILHIAVDGFDSPTAGCHGRSVVFPYVATDAKKKKKEKLF